MSDPITPYKLRALARKIDGDCETTEDIYTIMHALRSAADEIARLRAAPDVEPVAYMLSRDGAPQHVQFAKCMASGRDPEGWTETPLYTHPPAPDVAAAVAKARREALDEAAKVAQDLARYEDSDNDEQDAWCDGAVSAAHAIRALGEGEK